MDFYSAPPQNEEKYSVFFDYLEQHDYIKGSNSGWQNDFEVRSKPFFSKPYIKLESDLMPLTFIENFELNLRVDLINYFSSKSQNLNHFSLNKIIRKRTNKILFCLNNKSISLEEIHAKLGEEKKIYFDFIFETIKTETKGQKLKEISIVTTSSYKKVVVDLLPLFMYFKLKSKNFRSFIRLCCF